MVPASRFYDPTVDYGVVNFKDTVDCWVVSSVDNTNTPERKSGRGGHEKKVENGEKKKR